MTNNVLQASLRIRTAFPSRTSLDAGIADANADRMNWSYGWKGLASLLSPLFAALEIGNFPCQFESGFDETSGVPAATVQVTMFCCKP
jgi:hypothetical protein